MVKQTFYNLSPHKKARIINAIIKEIDGKTFEDISINQIVKNAEISRGSFYQYFDDKQDVFYVVMQGFSDSLNEKCKTALQQNNGDLFLACTDIFDFIIESSKQKRYSAAFKTVFSCANINRDFIPFEAKNCKEIPLIVEIIKNVNYNLLNGGAEADIENMVIIISAVLIRSCFEVFVLGKDKKIVKEHLQKMFLIMKDGFYRR